MADLSSRAKMTLDRYRAAETLPNDRKQQLLQALQSRIARGAIVSPELNVDPPIAPGSAAATGGASAIAKLVAGVGLATGIAVPAYFVVSEPAHEPPAQNSVVSAQVTVAKEHAPAEPVPEHETPQIEINEPLPETRRALPKQAKTTSRTKPALPPTIDEEVRLLKSAQAALSSGQPARALSVLQEHGTRYPKSQLADAREVTRITALCNLGQRAQARQLAERFLAKNPNSPFSGRVRRICE